MTKKEAAALNAAILEAQIARALRWPDRAGVSSGPLPAARTAKQESRMKKSQDTEMREVLTELLRLYDWRFELAERESAFARDFNDNAERRAGERLLRADLRKYGEQKKAAWERARAILSAIPEPDRTFSDIVHFAFRYALGRMTYAPSLVADYIRENADRIEAGRLAQMALEITERGEHGNLGMAIDADVWRDLRTWIETRVYPPVSQPSTVEKKS